MSGIKSETLKINTNNLWLPFLKHLDYLTILKCTVYQEIELCIKSEINTTMFMLAM